MNDKIAIQIQSGSAEEALTWKYASRYDMQPIYTDARIFIGPFQVAKDKPKLQLHKITHILMIRSREETYIKQYFPNEFIYETLFLENSAFEHLNRVLPQTCNWIRNVLLDINNRILIHCVGGISRAPTIALAHLMENEGLNFDNAFHIIQRSRFCINPSESFLCQLKVGCC